MKGLKKLKKCSECYTLMGASWSVGRYLATMKIDRAPESDKPMHLLDTWTSTPDRRAKEFVILSRKVKKKQKPGSRFTR